MSISHVIDDLQPSLICLVETHLPDEDIKIDGYSKLFFNNNTSDSGGILIGVKDVLRNITTEVHRFNEVGQSLWITLDNNKVSLRVGVIYAPQESQTRKNKLSIMYSDIERQIEIAADKKQKLLLLGDFNCKVGDAIQNNSAKVSVGGRLLLKMIKNQNLVLLNSKNICKGLWTREEDQKNL